MARARRRSTGHRATWRAGHALVHRGQRSGARDAGRRGPGEAAWNALRPGWRPVHTTRVFVRGSFARTGDAGRTRRPISGPTKPLRPRPVLQLRPPPPGERSSPRSPWSGGASPPARRCDDGSRRHVDGSIPGVHTRRLHRGVQGDALPSSDALDPDGLADHGPAGPGSRDVPAGVPAAQLCPFRLPHHQHVRLDDGRNAAGPVPVAPGGRSAASVAVDAPVQGSPVLRSRTRGPHDRGAIRFRLEVQRPQGLSAVRLADAAKPLPRRFPWTRVGSCG